jgi:radical SAM superfamily enzyme YgiQ (UPF0313 family)
LPSHLGFQMKVYLADLRYDYSGVVANDCMPLGIAYMKAVMDREDVDKEIQSRLFVYPQRLAQALLDEPPDVLMLTNYVWNEALSHYFFSLAKRVNPNCLTVMGGPNISLESTRQCDYVARHPDLDVYALGEGDFLAYEIVRTHLDTGMRLHALRDGGLPSSVVRMADGSAVSRDMPPRHALVHEIPSPFLSGTQDEFFDGRLAPMIETNRGCPFTCTFCVQGTRYYTKVHNFPVERMKDEIRYIAKRIKQYSPNMGTLRIADSNYGMFERDIEISECIGEVQRDYGWPTFIDATTGKNMADRIIKSVEKVGGALMLYQAVQSLDEDVLRKVKRQSIKLDTYKALEVHMRGRGLRSVSDLILGLPGESLQTHLKGLHHLLDTNIHQMHNFQAMMLKGAELETLESREMFKFDTRFRVLPKNFGVYGEQKVFDVEEIIVATDTLPYADYLTCRKWHLVSSVFWNDGWFEDVARFTRSLGIKNSDWWAALLPAMENGTEAVQGFLADFVGETNGELFATREDCVAFYSRDENFDRLQRGEIGDNLMYRYRAIASFFLWPEICHCAMQATRDLLRRRGLTDGIAHFDGFWDDFSTYTLHKHASGSERSQLLDPVVAPLQHDIAAWLSQAELGDPIAFRLPSPRSFVFQLSEDAKRELSAALSVWTLHIKGLTKMVTRINVSWQVRECVAARDGLATDADVDAATPSCAA